MNLTTAQLRYLIMIYQLQKNGRVRLLRQTGPEKRPRRSVARIEPEPAGSLRARGRRHVYHRTQKRLNPNLKTPKNRRAYEIKPNSEKTTGRYWYYRPVCDLTVKLLKINH